MNSMKLSIGMQRGAFAQPSDLLPRYEIDVAVEKIVATPERFPPTYAGCRRYTLNRYPYNVIYYQTDERIFIVAIAHMKRHPTYWRSRLK